MNGLHFEYELSKNKLWSALVDSLRGIVWEADPYTFQFSFVSPQVVNILGYPSQQWLDEPNFWRTHTHPDDVERCADFCNGAAAGKEEFEFHYRMIAADNRVVWLHTIVMAERENGDIRLRGVMIDITDRKRSEEELNLKSFTIDNLAEEILWSMPDGRISDVNAVVCKKLGYTREELLNLSISDIDPFYTKEVWATHWGDLKASGSLQFESLHKSKDGHVYPVEIIANYLKYNNLEYNYAIVRDISKYKNMEKALQKSEEQFRTLCKFAPIGIFKADLTGNNLYMNPLGKEITEMYASEKIMESWFNAIHPDDCKDLLSVWHESTSTADLFSHECRIVTPQGKTKWIRVLGNPLKSPNGMVTSYVGTLEDVGHEKMAEAEILRLAYRDSLTGLPNRLLLNDRLNYMLANAKRYEYVSAVLFIDLDNFKVVNDSFGHAAGDQLLCEVSKRFETEIRKADTIARMGGDEFVILLEVINTPAAAALTAQHLLRVLVAPFSINGQDIYATASIGIALYPEDGTDADSLLKNADVAMYHAKEGGRNAFHFYTAEINLRVEERLRLENELRQALDRNEFFLQYQPKWDIATGKMTGMEALLRWSHPMFGEVPPDKFISIAEETGLIVPIGDWVLRTAFRMLQELKMANAPHLRVSVNISNRQFRHLGLTGNIAALLAESGVNPTSLELEITENSLMQNVDDAVKVLSTLKSMGVSLAIDDFGKGFSSLYFLKKFHLNRLKVDRSFIRDVVEDEDDAAIVRAMIALAKSLKLEVTAEGIETDAQVEFVRTHGCNEVQGYYFSRPVMEEKIHEYLKMHHEDFHSLIPDTYYIGERSPSRRRGHGARARSSASRPQSNLL